MMQSGISAVALAFFVPIFDNMAALSQLKITFSLSVCGETMSPRSNGAAPPFI